MLGGRSVEGVWGEAFGRVSDIAARKVRWVIDQVDGDLCCGKEYWSVRNC